MASVERRIEALEAQLGPPKDEIAEQRWATMRDILNEFSDLKASRAVGYRAGVRREPENIPGRILGPGYTTGEMWGLAARRVFERRRENAPDTLDEEAVEELVEGWTEAFRKFSEDEGHDWHKVENSDE
jgi:hypothetical protein